MPVAVGIYLPLALAVPIFLGGLTRRVFGRAAPGARPAGAHDAGILFGSGLIAGEAFIGIALAIPITLGYKLPSLGGHWTLSLLIFGAIAALYASLARRSSRVARG
jgi:uncharacterized oligopeptide transporter (OPT) family protein